MQNRLERNEEQDTVDYMLDNYGIESIKQTFMGSRGWPDRIFLLPRRPAWIEFKKKGKKPRKLQIYRMKKLKSLGYDVTWTDNKNEAILWLEKIFASRLSNEGNNSDDKAGLRGASARPRTG